jgi:hypothetical protein
MSLLKPGPSHVPQRSLVHSRLGWWRVMDPSAMALPVYPRKTATREATTMLPGGCCGRAEVAISVEDAQTWYTSHSDTVSPGASTQGFL